MMCILLTLLEPCPLAVAKAGSWIVVSFYVSPLRAMVHELSCGYHVGLNIVVTFPSRLAIVVSFSHRGTTKLGWALIPP